MFAKVEFSIVTEFFASAQDSLCRTSNVMQFVIMLETIFRMESSLIDFIFVSYNEHHLYEHY